MIRISRPQLFQILIVFLLSRALVYVLGVYSYSIFPERGEVYSKKNAAEVIDVERVWKRWDSDWYERLARDGYPDRTFTADRQETWGYMPLYPLLMAGLAWLTGCSLFTSGLILSNLCTFLALLVLYRLFQDKFQNGFEGVILILFSAGSFYLGIVYTEGLFLLFTSLVFFLSHRRNFGWALMVAGLASVTRIQGCLLFMIPGLELLLHHRKDIFRYAPAVIFSLLPMILFIVYLERTCGEPLAFIKIQQAWGSEHLIPLQGFAGLFTGVRPGASYANAFFWLMILGITLLSFKKLPLSYSIFTIFYLLLSTSNSSLYGSTRYMLGILPVFAALSIGDKYLRYFFIVVNLLFLSLTITDFVTDSMVFL